MTARRAALIDGASSGMGNDQRASASKEGWGRLCLRKKALMSAVCSEMSVESSEILLGEDILYYSVIEESDM
jgi:hypothetical protein